MRGSTARAAALTATAHAVPCASESRSGSAPIAGRNSRPRVLLVGDDRDAAGLIHRALDDHFGPGCTRRCATVAQALDQDSADVDLVLSAMQVCDGSALDVLGRLLQSCPDLPIVLLTAEAELDSALEAIRRGAYDYVVTSGDYWSAIPLVVEKNLAIWRTKQENARLHRQLERTLEEVQFKNKQLEEAVQKLATMAATDPLTGLANRRAFNEALRRSFAEAGRYRHDLSCIMIDLDRFKQLNDALGHQAGDELLRRTARILQANCRRSDVAGRFGGDEFTLLLPQTDMVTSEGVAGRILAQYVAAADAMLEGRPRARRVGMSMGVASLRRSRPTSPEALISHADRALYRAKELADVSVVPYVSERVELGPVSAA